MKVTTQVFIAGIIIFLVGAAMLLWGPERHDSISTVVLFGGMGLMGVKPIAQATQTHKENRP